MPSRNCSTLLFEQRSRGFRCIFLASGTLRKKYVKRKKSIAKTNKKYEKIGKFEEKNYEVKGKRETVGNEEERK